jgi:hypothetical protein
VELLFFDRADDSWPARIMRINPALTALTLLAHLCAGRAAGADLRLPGSGTMLDGRAAEQSRLLQPPKAEVLAAASGTRANRFNTRRQGIG